MHAIQCCQILMRAAGFWQQIEMRPAARGRRTSACHFLGSCHFEGMDQSKSKLKILFLCTGNSCRSQMAEGWTRHLKGQFIEPYSAGIEKHGMNPHALKVMAEAGVDMSRQYSKTLNEVAGVTFDYVITVCGHAHESCPIFPGKTKVIHVGFEDPPSLTRHLPDGEEKLAVYRRVRDEIRRFVETLPESLQSSH